MYKQTYTKALSLLGKKIVAVEVGLHLSYSEGLWKHQKVNTTYKNPRQTQTKNQAFIKTGRSSAGFAHLHVNATMPCRRRAASWQHWCLSPRETMWEVISAHL